MEQTSKEDEQVRQQPGVRWIIMWDNLETNPGTVCGKAVTKEQRPSTAPCLADTNILEGLWLLLGEGLLEDEGDRDLDEDGDVVQDVLDNESLKSDIMTGKLSGLRN